MTFVVLIDENTTTNWSLGYSYFYSIKMNSFQAKKEKEVGKHLLLFLLITIRGTHAHAKRIDEYAKWEDKKEGKSEFFDSSFEALHSP